MYIDVYWHSSMTFRSFNKISDHRILPTVVNKNAALQEDLTERQQSILENANS